jgi:hypothetical protein
MYELSIYIKYKLMWVFRGFKGVEYFFGGLVTVINQHQLDTLSLVCLLGVKAPKCFGRYSPIFRRICTDAIWCNYVRRMCVDYVQVAFHATCT